MEVTGRLAVDPSSIPNATNVSYEARGPSYGRFNAYTQMERAADAEEVSRLTDRHPDPVLLFVEPRENTIRMRDRIPLVWTQRGPNTKQEVHLGAAQPNEFFVFQVGIFAAGADVSMVSAEFSDLQGSLGGTIGKHRLASPNLGGRDSLGRDFNRTISVEKGEVGVLFVGLNLTADDAPQLYTGNISLALGLADGSSSDALVKFAVELSPGPALADRGDGERAKMSRLRWLDSQVGLDDRPAKRFAPLSLDRSTGTYSTWSTDVSIGPNGLPRQILRRSAGNRNDPAAGLLAQPMRLRITDRSARSVAGSGELSFGATKPDLQTWTSRGTQADLQVSTAALAEADGYSFYELTVSNGGPTQVELADIALEMPLHKSAVPYFMGLGKPGGYRPREWAWNWLVDSKSASANSMAWIGDTELGVRLKLRGAGSEWNVPQHGVHGIGDVPRSWGGRIHENVSRTHAGLVHNLTIFRGGVNMTEPDANTVLVSAFSGPQSLASGSNLTFVFELQLTPARPFEPSVQLRQRYSELGGMSLPTTPSAIASFVDNLFSTGVRTVNIHRASSHRCCSNRRLGQ